MSQGKRPFFSGTGPDRRGLAWFLAFRVAIITLFLGGTAVFFLSGKMGGVVAPLLFLLLALSYLQALFSALALLKVSNYTLFAQAQLFWDLLFVTALIFITGGVESAFSFVYLLVIVSGSFLLTRRKTIYVAGTAAILYGGLLDLQYFGYLKGAGSLSPAEYAPYLYSVFVHVLAFLLTGLLSGTLAERWRTSEEELKRKSIDYQELDRLNRTILSHISSGLMIVNRYGRIRSFNSAATEITGYSLEMVYDQQVERFFPEITVVENGRYLVVSRQETTVVNRKGEKIVLGYATTRIKDHREVEVGLLVTFQDLTRLKVVEEQLSRSDRLAAVGRLASGMAHEIRNPLASISGSVQLLLEGAKLELEDRRLAGIVVREADRLTELLTDFLHFARPRDPHCDFFLVRELLLELRDMLLVDPRFAGHIDVEVNCSAEARIFADRSMVRQALWNLLLNAVEAMNGKGVVRVGFDVDSRLLSVEDQGPGVSEDIRGQIFDPFFSSKEKGTGLGLATVFSIMEAHCGTIHLKQGPLGGASFQLEFPLSDEV